MEKNLEVLGDISVENDIFNKKIDEDTKKLEDEKTNLDKLLEEVNKLIQETSSNASIPVPPVSNKVQPKQPERQPTEQPTEQPNGQPTKGQKGGMKRLYKNRMIKKKDVIKEIMKNL